MQCFALSTLPLIEESRSRNLKQEWYADDSAGVGSIQGACEWFAKISREGKKYGYNVNAKKTIAIVRRDKLQEYKDVFEKRFGPDQRPKEVVILEEMTGVGDAEEELAGDPKEWGSRYLGAGMGGKRFREAYVKEKVER